jgi:hypothetical protein
MALNGYVTAEERRSRFVQTSIGLVVAVRQPQPSGVRAPMTSYAIYKDGALLGKVSRGTGGWCVEGIGGNYRTRQAAIERAVTDRTGLAGPAAQRAIANATRSA